MRRRMRRFLLTLAVIAAVILGMHVLTGALYHGPRTVNQVLTAMPAVPVFPLAALSPGNAFGQHAMAIPLWRLRRQGAARAETALLVVPADREFVIEWYELMAPPQGWTPAGKADNDRTTRLFFTRGHDGFQVLIGANQDLLCGFQLLYLHNISPALLRQLAAEFPSAR